jgi:putative two-component system response regulator
MKPKILVVDDVAINRCAICLSIRDRYIPIEATNGEDAVALAIKEKPDLILLDILMPGLDGFDTAKLLKSNPLTNRIPIVFVTALNKEEFRKRAEEVGVCDVLIKPFSPSILKARIKLHLKT